MDCVKRLISQRHFLICSSVFRLDSKDMKLNVFFTHCHNSNIPNTLPPNLVYYTKYDTVFFFTTKNLYNEAISYGKQYVSN